MELAGQLRGQVRLTHLPQTIRCERVEERKREREREWRKERERRMIKSQVYRSRNFNPPNLAKRQRDISEMFTAAHFFSIVYNFDKYFISFFSSIFYT